MDYRLLGDHIREYRMRKHMSQEKLAEMIDVSATYVGAIENARKRPSLTTLIKLANALGTTTDLLLSGNLWYDVLQCENEISGLLQDCSPYERHMILALARASKIALRQNKELVNLSFD